MSAAQDAPGVDRAGIARARRVIAAHVRRTPTIEVDPTDFGLPPDGRLTLKLEHLQHSGSFKARGAFANLLLREVPPAGVVAASGGNHGAAVAYAAMRLGTPARIFVPTIASPAKVRQIRECGAELVVVGELYADALEASERWVLESGALAVHAYDQVETLLGAGTLGAELEEQAPDLDTVLIAVGGGGLIGGVAAWAGGAPEAPASAPASLGHRPSHPLRIVGVEPELAPTLARALEAGHPVDAPAGGIAADALGPRQVGKLMFPIARRHVERVVLVPDEAIRAAQHALWRTLRLVVEPGGAAALAALLSGVYRPRPGEHLGVVLCGANTTAVSFEG